MANSIQWERKITSLLWKMFELQYSGSQGSKFRWMQGYTDGYIQAYLDLGIITEKQVLELIQNERRKFLENYENYILQSERKEKAA